MPSWLPGITDAALFAGYLVTAVALVRWLGRRRGDAPARLIGVLVAVLVLFAALRLLRLLGLDAAIMEWVRISTSGAVLCALVVVLLMIRPRSDSAGVVFDREALERAYAQERRARLELEAERVELESRSALLTLKHRRISSAFSATYVIALQWQVSSGKIEWEIGYAPAAHHLNMPHASFGNWSVFLDARALDLLERASRHAIQDNGGRLEFEAKITGSSHRSIRLSAMAVPEVRDEPVSLVGMMRIVVCEPTHDPPSPPH